MNATKLKNAEDAYRGSKDLKSWLKYFSIYTWNKIGFARIRNRLKMHETSITQDLVFQMSVALTQNNWSLNMYESTEESTNGNDLEILIETASGFVMLPCQAKIIYKNDKYTAIKHPVKIGEEPNITKTEQIELLLEYAKQEQGIPIYLFYNFCTNNKSLKEVEKNIDFDIEEYGCSVVSARLIHSYYHKKRTNKKGDLDWIIPTFADIHPKMAIPLHSLIDAISVMDKLLDTYDTDINNIPIQSSIKFYTLGEINENPKWLNVFEVTEESENSNSPKSKKRQKNNASGNGSFEKFQPKFRMVFDKVIAQ